MDDQEIAAVKWKSYLSDRYILMHKAFAYLIFIICVALFPACYAYRIFPKEDRRFVPSVKQKVHILNPELKREYRVIRHAKIFDIIPADSADPSAVSIRLEPMRHQMDDGPAIIITAFTLGQVPSLYADRYYYGFTEIRDTGIARTSIELRVAKRFWFWDMFTFQHSFSKKAGQALTAAYARQLEGVK